MNNYEKVNKYLNVKGRHWNKKKNKKIFNTLFWEISSIIWNIFLDLQEKGGGCPPSHCS